MEQEAIDIQTRCAQQALTSTGLVLGIDDFAIRKTRLYNTGPQDLRGGTFLDLIPGRTVEELQAYYQQQPIWALLHSVVVFMDLVKGYLIRLPK